MSKVFVIGSFIPAGGTFMAYSVGEVFHKHFGIESVAVLVGEESIANSPFDFERIPSAVSFDEFCKIVTPQDFVICNPSFSYLGLGVRIKARKIMYAQGFSTFEKIDGFFDHYVSVSAHVKDYISSIYDIETIIIPAYINNDLSAEHLQWQDRDPFTILVSQKVKTPLDIATANHIKSEIQRRVPTVRFVEIESGNHKALLKQINSHRYLMALNIAEGFGLIPLEAMASGTVVMGWNGFGGKQYMRKGQNCVTASYPNISELIDLSCSVLEDQSLALSISQDANKTSKEYGKDIFEQNWINYINSII